MMRTVYKALNSLFFLTAIFLPIFLQADEALSDIDREAVASFINSKRTIDTAEKAKELKISGDVRAEFQNRHERGLKQNSAGVFEEQYLRCHDAITSSDIPIPCNSYAAQLNIRLDYKGERTWASGYLQFANSAGIENVDNCGNDKEGCTGSGECEDICLKRAFMGWNVYRCGEIYFDIECGRRPLYTIFDSRIQYHARFDGLLFKLAYGPTTWGEYYIKGGPFVVDYRVDHYAYITEIGVFNFLDHGFDIKYSFVDWFNPGKNICQVVGARGWRFVNSQWTLAYNIKNFPRLNKKMRLYGAFLVNHAARRNELSNDMLRNLGWYAGVITGEVKKQGDWSLDINYQVVEAQAVADCDMHGIGRGNVLRETFTANRRGKGNYRGWQFELLYALTDKLSIDVDYEFSNAEDKRIGGSHSYHKFELDVIHAF
jgi:hypothetical protein